jgi:hypothetical protein
MGIVGLWTFLQHEGYEAKACTLSHLPNHSSHTIHRVDVLGSFYSTIRYAYTKEPLDIAHGIVEQELLRRGVPRTSVLYVDGHSPEEKRRVNDDREHNRSKAVLRAQSFLDTLEQRLDDKLRVRKALFTKINKNIDAAFYWSLDARKAFAEYMKTRGWMVRECPTEADVAIARDSTQSDVIISSDSDMLAFASVATIWRPTSKSRFLVYHISSILKQLGITRAQLTALCIVCKNDYNRNIKWLGPMTNFNIIQSIEGVGRFEYHMPH